MKTLRDERYIVTKAYKFTVFERIIYCVSMQSNIYVESTDSVVRLREVVHNNTNLLPTQKITKRGKLAQHVH